VTPAPATVAVTGAQDNLRRKTEEDYLSQLIRKLPRVLYVPKSREPTRTGVVVTRVTVARNGQLLDIALTRSSGSPGLDQDLIESIRRAAPFAPLPNDLPGNQLSFLVPINLSRQR
jgi:protein TonB